MIYSAIVFLPGLAGLFVGLFGRARTRRRRLDRVMIVVAVIAGMLVMGVGVGTMGVAVMFDLVAARIARMRTEDGDQPRENRADQGQKDDCLDHWRVNPSSD